VDITLSGGKNNKTKPQSQGQNGCILLKKSALARIGMQMPPLVYFGIP